MKTSVHLLTVLLLTPLAALSAAEPARKLNFLFIYTDDQRYDALGVVQKEQGEKGRFPWLKTPNLDRLAGQGVRFRNAFVVNSLCSPSRASFLTGCYGHVNGIVNNHTPFPAKNVTYATLLRSAGYTTGYIGKWHMDQQSGQRPGFDYSASFLGQGKYFDCPFEINGVRQATTGWVDDVSTDFTLRFLRANRDKPFCLAVGYKTTHGPWQPPKRAAKLYAEAQARPVPNLEVKAIYRTDLDVKHPGVVGDSPKLHNYMRCITATDDNVGRLLAALDELTLADNTVVVFASDNGYYLGEHGLGDKRSAYEESLRIPFVVRVPNSRAKGKVVDEMVLNTDLAPTFLDLAGVPVPKEMHGRSLKPLLVGKPSDWRRAFFYCYFRERAFNTPTVTAVRTEAAKLIKYPGHEEWTELFDLRVDPYEMNNLVNDPAAAALKEKLEVEYQKQSAANAFRISLLADEPLPGKPRE
jgi:arylsulfatase A-like enzyme